MRKKWVGVVVLVGISTAAVAVLSQNREQVLGQPPVGFVAETTQVTEPAQVVVQQPAEIQKWYVDFVTLPPLQGENMPRFRAITIVDTEAKRIAVYHLELATGQVWLRSVRDIQPDLMLNQHNATSPLPVEIMKELQRQRERPAGGN